MFNVTQNVSSSLDKYNLIHVTQEGKLVDSRSKTDFENNVLIPYDNSGESDPEKLNGTYTSYYFLDPNNYMVEGLFLECKIQLDVPQTITIEISNINDEAKLMLQSKVSLLVEEKERKKSNFFTTLIEVITGK